jgi:alpha-galactosidase
MSLVACASEEGLEPAGGEEFVEGDDAEFDTEFVEGDEAKASAGGKVKVFILAGQSNMVGQGIVTANTKQGQRRNGTLDWLAEQPGYGYLGKKGAWAAVPKMTLAEWGDSWGTPYTHNGPLTVFRDKVGPELGFGHGIRARLGGSAPILIIKTAWGGKSLHADFRPPSSQGGVGPSYTAMIGHIKEVLNNVKKYVPNGGSPEIVGFAWHQGWNDRDPKWVPEYAGHCRNLVKDLRNDLRSYSGGANMRFVIASTGMALDEGNQSSQKTGRQLVAAQGDCAYGAGAPANVECFHTEKYYYPEMQSPTNQGYHWRQNAKSYVNIGRDLATYMSSKPTGAARCPVSGGGSSPGKPPGHPGGNNGGMCRDEPGAACDANANMRRCLKNPTVQARCPRTCGLCR